MAEVPIDDRPRERLARMGPAGLSDAELIALVIRSGAAGCNAVHVAEELLAGAGGLCGVAHTPLESLAAGRAMGGAKAAALAAAFELGRRTARELPVSRVVRDASDIAIVARPFIRHPTREECLVVVLNRAHRVIKVESLTVGTAVRCLVEPRDVLEVVLRCGGVAFALVHTHPSGAPTPSAEDIAVTRRVQESASLVGLEFLDHVVVADTKHTSIVATGPGSQG